MILLNISGNNMRRVIEKDFKSYYRNNAIFFCEEYIFTYPNKKTPLINFKNGLDFCKDKILDVFLYKNILFVELVSPDHIPLSYFPTKAFLQNVVADEANIIFQAVQWLTWHKKHKFCCKCGNPITILQDAAEKKCHACNLSFYPSLSPAVMVLVKKDSKVLLARSPYFRDKMYSALAGFIDIGETAEQAVHREVREEVGIKITGLKYFGSQSWPFPSSFMIAYTALYLAGDINIDNNEIEDAQWFDCNQLPDLPSMPSISRMLINAAISDANDNR